MATRQQGLFRHYSKAEVMAQDWDSLMLKVGRLSNHYASFGEQSLAAKTTLGCAGPCAHGTACAVLTPCWLASAACSR
jgi:hypothetical protein